MNVYLALTDTLRVFFELFDTIGQRFFLNVVYQYEPWCLALAACVLAVCRKGIGWKIAFWSIAFLVFIYLLLYRMHWYSWIAWPVMLVTFSLAGSYERWYWIVRHLRHPLHLPGDTWKRLKNVRRANRRQTLMYIAYIVGVVGLLMLLRYLFSIPWDLPIILLAIGACVCLLGWVIVTLGDIDRTLESYRESDPRLQLYLDAVRTLMAKPLWGCVSLMSNDRLSDPDLPARGHTIWGMLFWIGRLPGVRWLLRILACKKWMPAIQSAFVIDRLEYAREKLWSDYTDKRYGELQSDDDSEHAASPESIPLKPDHAQSDLRRMRLKWLAMTEALAECYAFTQTKRPRRRPSVSAEILTAAELLGQAAQLQHVIICDSRKSQNEQLLDMERNLAIHFLDLSAHCIESWLEQDVTVETMAWTLRERYEHFCGLILDKEAFLSENKAGQVFQNRLRRILSLRYRLMARFQKSDMSDYEPNADADEIKAEQILQYRLRKLLLLRYRLMARFKQDMSDYEPSADVDEIAESSEIPLPEPTVQIQNAKWDLEATMAQIACFDASASLWIEKRRGDQVRVPWQGHDDKVFDPLAQLEILVAKATELTKKCNEPRQRIEHADRHIRRIAGLAIEQDMEHLCLGSEVWWELCMMAFNLYCSRNIMRIHRICAMAKIADNRDIEPIAELG